MVRTVDFKDPGRLELISQLEETARKSGSALWSTVACELSKVRRSRRQVNVHRIDKHTSEGDVVVIPGKVLGDGDLGHKVDVAAYRFTAGAAKKIEEAGGTAMSISELVKKNPKGGKVRLIG
jgi:large subunit ribosomal protein L18e